MPVILSFEIDSENVRKALEKTALELIGSVEKGIENLSKEVSDRMKKEAPVATGNLRNNVGYEIKTTKNTVVSEITSRAKNSAGKEYAYYIEFGRKDGKRPPIGAIKEWLRAKGLDEKYAMAVAKTIAIRGTQADNFVERTYNAIVKRAGKPVQNEINKKIRQIFK